MQQGETVLCIMRRNWLLFFDKNDDFQVKKQQKTIKNERFQVVFEGKTVVFTPKMRFKMM